MEINFGKYKGNTVEQIASTEEGKSYLRWLVDQPTEGKFKESNDKRNNYIRNVLSGSNGNEYKKEEKKSSESILISKLDQIINLLQQVAAKY